MTALRDPTETELGVLSHRDGDRDPEQYLIPVLTSAELAECTCPEFCERDHGNE